MSALIPAVDGRLNQVKDSGAVYDGVIIDQIFFHSHNCGHQLKSGSRRCSLLSRFVEQRGSQVGIQFRIVLLIHLVRQPVVVISRISDTGENLSRVDIRHNTGGRTGIQSQLTRRNLQITDFRNHEIIGRSRSGHQGFIHPVIF